METINRVELQGTVGNVRMQEAGERKVLHFSLVTNRVSRNKDGENIVEACWHNVEAWEGKNIADLTKIDKGSNVHLFGRIRYTKYVGAHFAGSRKTRELTAVSGNFSNFAVFL